MKFIPDRLKKLFSRKSAKPEAETPAPAAVVETPAPTPEPVKERAPPRNRMGELSMRQTAEGNYLLDLDVKILGQHNGNTLHMISNRDTGFQLALLTPQYLSGVKTVSTHAEDHMYNTFGFDVGHVFFKRKDANFHFDGYDELLGLPPGDGFQLLLVPEGSNWRPPYAPPCRYAIPGTGTVLQHPVTLLPQFQPQVVYPIMFVNGMDMLTPQLPKMAVAQPEQKKPEQKKPEEKPAGDAVATPAAAPPPPPKM